MLEKAQHERSCFVTLTYDDGHYPKVINKKVMRDEVQRWLKRLRYYASGFRYFVVAERGEKTARLHYHGLLFGIAFDEHQNPRKDFRCTCRLCTSWAFGGAYVGDVEEKSASYVLGYITDGRKSEIALMSRRPGIGAWSADDIGVFMRSKEGSRYIAAAKDVVGIVRRSGQLWPLGRYLRGRLREAVGMEACEPEWSRAGRLGVLQAELRDVELRTKREMRQEHAVATAKARYQINRSKVRERL